MAVSVPNDFAFVHPTRLQLSISRKYLNPDFINVEETEKKIAVFLPSYIEVNSGLNMSNEYEVDGIKYWLVDNNKKNDVLEEFTFDVSKEKFIPALVKVEVRLSTHEGYVISSNVLFSFM